MIDMHSKFDNIDNNGMFNALIDINNHIITSINYILSMRSTTAMEFEDTNRYG